MAVNLEPSKIIRIAPIGEKSLKNGTRVDFHSSKDASEMGLVEPKKMFLALSLDFLRNFTL